MQVQKYPANKKPKDLYLDAPVIGVSNRRDVQARPLICPQCATAVRGEEAWPVPAARLADDIQAGARSRVSDGGIPAKNLVTTGTPQDPFIL